MILKSLLGNKYKDEDHEVRLFATKINILETTRSIKATKINEYPKTYNRRPQKATKTQRQNHIRREKANVGWSAW